MRLLVVSAYYAPHIGGIETVAHEQATRLAALGWEVTVCTSRLGGDDAEEQDGAVSVRRFRSVNLLERTVRVPVPIPSWGLARSVRDAGADVAIVHGHTYLSSYAAARALVRCGSPYVLVQHNPWIDSYPAPLLVLQRMADRTIGRKVLGRAARVIAVSRATADYVEQVAPGIEPEVLFSGVDSDRFRPSDPPLRLRPRVVTLRRLVPRQGVEILIAAWVRHGIGSCADLVIAGTGPDLAALRRMAHGDHSISFAGRIPGDELAAFYTDSDFVVLPSIAGEGFGLVAAEAIACGRPVIATAAGGPLELIRPGVDGLLVPPGDPDELAVALLRLIRHPDERRALSRGAAQRDLSWGPSIRRLDEVLRSAAAAVSPG